MAKNQITGESRLLVIGGSAGSLEVIMNLIPRLNPALHFAILIIVHRMPSVDTLLVDLLSSRMDIPVKEAEEKENILPGHVYIAPPDYHVLIEKNKTLSLDVSEKINYSRPSIDVTFTAAADVYKNSLVAVLLSGANADGTEGLKQVKAHGGICIVQDPQTAEVEYMPRTAINQVEVDKVLPPGAMAEYINNLAPGN